MAMKFHGWLQFGVRRAYPARICRSCFKVILLPILTTIELIDSGNTILQETDVTNWPFQVAKKYIAWDCH